MTVARRGISPVVLFLGVALIGSLAFELYAVTARDVPLLAAASAVLGIVFIAVSVFALRAIWRAGIDGRSGRALAMGIGGGLAAMIGAGCIAGAIILFLLSQTPTA